MKCYQNLKFQFWINQVYLLRITALIMIRTIITPQNQNVSIQIPKNYIGKKVEFIAFAIDEPQENSKEKIMTHFASENVLAKDWLSKKEDLAWKDL